ncbi:MAG: hypothetical protein ACOC80_00620 [Petrotogales bacterium]
MDKKQFEVKKEHLLLLQRMNVGWSNCEFGAPEVDPKRPYGNSSVEQDILEIIGLKELKEGIYEFMLFGKKWLLRGEDKYNIYLEGADEEKLCEELIKLHKETEIALQICLATKAFKEGLYEADEYSSDWEEVKPNSSRILW